MVTIFGFIVLNQIENERFSIKLWHKKTGLKPVSKF